MGDVPLGAGLSSSASLQASVAMYLIGDGVIADPVHPGMVYITTFGGGVWHGAVDGKPGVEDIASKEIAP